MIEIKNLSAGYGGGDVLNDVSLTVPAGKVLILLGPNGCGKSTLFKTIIGLHEKSSGEMLIDGVSSDTLTPRELSQKVAYLAQSRNVPNITARRMVLHGRFPYLSYPRKYRKEDYKAADEALRLADALDIAERPVTELSGGERQKVYIAMALAQGTDTILMDEPTTFLDVSHQLEVMKISHRLSASGKAVALVLHDICLSMKSADIIAVMQDGKIRSLGTPDEVFSSGVIDEVFGITLRRTLSDGTFQYYYA